MRAHTTTTDGEDVAEETRPSAIPRVVGLLMVVLAIVGLMQSLAGLWAGPDFEAFLVLGEDVGRWQAFGFWVHLTGLFVGGVHLVAGVAAAMGRGRWLGRWRGRWRRRAPLLASVYAGVAVLRIIGVVIVYYQVVAPLLRPYGKTELFGGHGVGLVMHAGLLLGWAALVVVLMNLRGSRRACSA